MQRQRREGEQREREKEDIPRQQPKQAAGRFTALQTYTPVPAR